MSFRYEVRFTVKVDEENNMFSLLDDDIEIVEDAIINSLRDIDDVKIVNFEVYKE